ncbi:MAG TPA: hypothetical protein VGH17_05050 [Candidatus Acidoferrales bacterium]|jgi:hypothetical protein
MAAKAKRADVIAASEDLRSRTLAQTSGALDGMIYLASMRDYNTGLYVHQGLAARFSAEVACEALADCHQECFRELISLGLKELTEQLNVYMRSTGTTADDFLRTWRELEPYRVAIPVGTESLAAQFLFSNLKVALAILNHQNSRVPEPTPVA